MGHAILLAFAGLASGALAAWPVLGGHANSIAAGLLGIVLAAYLWLHAGIRAPGRLAVVVFAAIVGHYIMMFVGLAGLFLVAIQPNHGNLTATFAMAPAAAVGAALIAVVFLQVLPSKRDQLGLEIACCAIAGGLAGLLWGFGEFATVRWLVRLQAWNGAVAGVLGLVAHLRSRPAATNTTALRLLAGAGLAAICALLAFGDTLRAAAPQAAYVVESPYAAVDREARVKSLSEAPPSVDLPAVPSVPARGMFTPGRIAGFACFPPTDAALAPDTTEVDSMQLRVPARHQYHSQCYSEKEGPQAPGTVHVWIVQYPNIAWARYDLRTLDGYQGVVQDRSNVKRITKHGRPIFAGRTKTYWSSGDKLITVGGSAPPEILDAFIEAYLTRYPNTLEPGFDLPYLPPR